MEDLGGVGMNEYEVEEYKEERMMVEEGGWVEEKQGLSFFTNRCKFWTRFYRFFHSTLSQCYTSYIAS